MSFDKTCPVVRFFRLSFPATKEITLTQLLFRRFTVKYHKSIMTYFYQELSIKILLLLFYILTMVMMEKILVTNVCECKTEIKSIRLVVYY